MHKPFATLTVDAGEIRKEVWPHHRTKMTINGVSIEEAEEAAHSMAALTGKPVVVLYYADVIEDPCELRVCPEDHASDRRKIH